MNERLMNSRTSLTIYPAHDERSLHPPAPILVDEHYFVRSGLEQLPARLIGFSPAGAIAITAWVHDVFRPPELARDLYPTFIIAGRVHAHPIPAARVTVREPSGVVQVVITDPRGKRYRPYLGEDRDVADRIAAAWGSHRGYSATVQPITPATSA